jgi:hypothetical protein
VIESMGAPGGVEPPTNGLGIQLPLVLSVVCNCIKLCLFVVFGAHGAQNVGYIFGPHDRMKLVAS